MERVPAESVTPAFRGSERVLLCLTTLRHRRFVEDVVHMVGLPPGSPLRLRYRRKYVSEQFWLNVKSGDPLGVEQVLVLLGAGREDDPGHVASLRLASITQARCKGELLILDVALGDFAYEPFPGVNFPVELRKIASRLPNGYGTGAPKDGDFVQVPSRPPTSLVRSSSVSAWEDVAQSVLQLDDLSCDEKGEACIPFLFYLDRLAGQAQARLEKTGALRVEAGSRLDLDVHTLTRRTMGILRNPLGEVVLEVANPAATFTTSRRVRVDSLRDVKRISLVTSGLFRRAQGHLSIRTVHFQSAGDHVKRDVLTVRPAKEREPVILARYDFPFVVGRWRPIAAAAMVALTAAIATYKKVDTSDMAGLSFVLPALVFALAFTGLVSGFGREGKSS